MQNNVTGTNWLREGFISDPPKLENPRTGVERLELLSGTRERKLK